MIRIIIIFSLYQTCVCFGQNFCDSKTRDTNEKKFLKAERRNKADTYEFTDLAFNIAECFMQNNDTTSLIWFRRTIISGRSSVKGCDLYHNTEVKKMMGQVGISEYYLGHYEEGVRFLEKAITNGRNPDHNYFLGLCYMKLKNYDTAIIKFNHFKIASKDFKDVDELIKICHEKKGSK